MRDTKTEFYWQTVKVFEEDPGRLRLDGEQWLDGFPVPTVKDWETSRVTVAEEEYNGLVEDELMRLCNHDSGLLNVLDDDGEWDVFVIEDYFINCDSNYNDDYDTELLAFWRAGRLRRNDNSETHAGMSVTDVLLKYHEGELEVLGRDDKWVLFEGPATDEEIVELWKKDEAREVERHNGLTWAEAWELRQAGKLGSAGSHSTGDETVTRWRPVSGSEQYIRELWRIGRVQAGTEEELAELAAREEAAVKRREEGLEKTPGRRIDRLEDRVKAIEEEVWPT